MILYNFKTRYGLRLGVKTARGVIDVRAARQALKFAEGQPFADTPAAFYRRGLAALPALRSLVELALAQPGKPAWLLDEAALKPGPVVPNPEKILCVGLNYRNHAREAGLGLPPAPVLFSKFNNSISACGEAIPLSPLVYKYDYEAELAVVIGKKAHCVPVEKALDYVLGYCNANDVSNRELQNLTSQWLLGKTMDKFFPTGPYLVTTDEAGDPQNFPVRCWLNGELRQNSNTSDMIFSTAELISFASQYMTLKPGDIISTGTPEGVTLGRAQKDWMKPGDVMVVEVGPLGRLTNPVVKE